MSAENVWARSEADQPIVYIHSRTKIHMATFPNEHIVNVINHFGGCELGCIKRRL